MSEYENHKSSSWLLESDPYSSSMLSGSEGGRQIRAKLTVNYEQRVNPSPTGDRQAGYSYPTSRILVLHHRTTIIINDGNFLSQRSVSFLSPNIIYAPSSPEILIQYSSKHNAKHNTLQNT